MSNIFAGILALITRSRAPKPPPQRKHYINPYEADKPGFFMKPCPFCESINILKASRREVHVWAECLECHAMGPTKLTGRAADTAWNQRAEVKP